ncbi:glycosyltransferase family 4 protein [Myroides odoratimimus]|uniref:glycosyltransferase n=1 Tax=Myroides odoratimimus TaxID=76832 RepID=UPI002576F156|nr:glycosyltransferase [Myroides odoratimimus]MDM1506883.1 glycosyltransferase family 4 protein [Myroides odoratimimus]MDM1537765.1 glycosyltransferase family 4 protein [Myroides odoratimimus]MDM1677318.1 glycosyltransferase family 4 protein [Myroides odoratimimus]MDM1680389.1 glycosyltransferase family 4 protein [Myroides odoratimimus]
MKAIFIHDHNFVLNPNDGLYYDGSGGVFTSDLWKRYLAVFNELIVIGRGIDILPNKLVLSSCDNVSFSLIDNVHSIKSRLFEKRRIINEIRQAIIDCDFVIIRLPSFLGSIAFEICKELKKKYMIEVVGDPYEAYKYHGALLGKIVAPLEMVKLKRIVREANNVVYVTQSKLQERYSNQFNNIGISNVQLYNLISNESVRNYYLENTSEFFKVGLIGTFHVKYKGHYELLKAVNLLKSEGIDNIKVYFVGTGDPTWVVTLAEEMNLSNNIVIVGALEAGENGIIPFLDTLDCYIHPSKTEGLPRVVIEAMSRGKMCLTSNAGGVEELIESNYVHSAGNWLMLKEQLNMVYNFSNTERYELGMQNLEKSSFYLEETLQKKRITFIKNIIRDVAN